MGDGLELRRWMRLMEDVEPRPPHGRHPPSDPTANFDYLWNDRPAFCAAMWRKDRAEAGHEGFVTDRKFNVAYHRLKRLQALGDLPIMRFMQLRPQFVKTLQAGADLGKSWSFKFLPKNIDEYDFFDQSVRGEPWYVLDATVSFAHINITQTFYLNCMFPHEHEINMKEDIQPVALVSIRRLLNNRRSDRNLRPDLVGKTFYARARTDDA